MQYNQPALQPAHHLPPAYPGPLPSYGGSPYQAAPLAYNLLPPPPAGGYAAPRAYAFPPHPSPIPHRVSVDLTQHRQRESIAARITKLMGQSDKSFGTPIFQGPPVTPPVELTYRQDPSLFSDRLKEVFHNAGMGALRLAPDVSTAAGAVNVMKAWPDDGTPLRFDIIYTMFPPTMEITTTIANGQPVQVHNLNGGMSWVQFEHFTVTDAIRLFVSETTRHGVSAAHAGHALNNIRLRDGESWITALHRLTQLARAASVDPDRPYLAEEPYYWRVLTAQALHHLMTRAVSLCFPQRVDQSTFHAHLVGVMQHNRALLQQHPIDVHALGSPPMCRRGDVCRDCFRKFADTLGQNAAFFHRTGGQPKSTAVSALQLASQRLPPGEDTFTHQSRPTLRRPSPAVALLDDGAARRLAEDGDSTSDSGREDNAVAAFDDARRRPRAGAAAALAAPSERRSHSGFATAAPASGRKRDRTPNTGASGAEAADSRRPRRTTWEPAAARGRPTGDRRLPADAPDPDADQKAIQEYIKAHKVCFNHARGLNCKYMDRDHQCQYLHTREPIPFGAYPRPPPARAPVAAMGAFDENLLYAAEAMAEWTATDATVAAGPPEAQA